MSGVKLRSQAADGQSLEATFLPEKGLNLISYKKGGCEVIDPATQTLFEERFAGLGALIGPHFHHRKVIPPVKDETLFPHIARLKAKGILEPFSHGIARYAPWKVETTETQLKGRLTGKDTWMDIPLASLEGQNFAMDMEINLAADGLHLQLAVVSDTDSLVGIHYYYRLGKQGGKVMSKVQPRYIADGILQPIPADWNYDSQNVLLFDLKQEADYTFYPFPEPRKGTIELDTGDYLLRTHFTAPSQECCWQLYHPREATFACIEPISAQDPRHPNLTASRIAIHLEIVTRD